MSHIIKWEQLKEYCQKLLVAQGMVEEEARIVADCLVDADLCGVESHGTSRMPIYLKRLQEGVVNKKSEIKLDNETSAIMAVDGCNSMGMVTGVRVMEKCIEKAREVGVAFATVRNSNHYGTCAYYTRLAAKNNMIGITATNAPPNIAPWGSYKPYLGTNPISFAIPRKGAESIVLDMTPSVVAMGKIILAAKLGQDIPLGWAIDNEGNPTTNAKKGVEGSVVPIGGPKGYGLALMVDILAGILSGATFGPHLGHMWLDFVNPQNLGHIFLVIDISKFIPLDTFEEKIEQIVKEIKEMPKNPGISEIFLPGEIEGNKKAHRKANGIELSDVVYEELRALGDKLNVAFTL